MAMEIGVPQIGTRKIWTFDRRAAYRKLLCIEHDLLFDIVGRVFDRKIRLAQNRIDEPRALDVGSFE